jgi:hypothetical protein
MHFLHNPATHRLNQCLLLMLQKTTNEGKQWTWNLLLFYKIILGILYQLNPTSILLEINEFIVLRPMLMALWSGTRHDW